MLTGGNEDWNTRERDENTVRAAEMKYMGRTEGYTRLDYKNNYNKLFVQMHEFLL
jgi:hypothetical protein